MLENISRTNHKIYNIYYIKYIKYKIKASHARLRTTPQHYMQNPFLTRSWSAPVVDSVAQDGHVVGVQNAVAEAHALPCRHEPTGALGDLAEPRRIAVLPTCATRLTA